MSKCEDGTQIATLGIPNLSMSRLCHELRTPLHAVLFNSQLLQADPRERLSERQQSRVDSIQLAGWHMNALIADLLEAAVIEAGGLKIDAQTVVLTDLLDEVLRLMSARAESERVSLCPAYRARPPACAWADPMRLRQIMLNIVGNAVKYSGPDTSVYVGVRTGGNSVQVEVADNGPGMTCEQLKHLFEPFNRLGRESGAVEGSGLGLVLTRQMVELMQGRLEFRSERGDGTTVCITLPVPADDGRVARG